MEKQQLDPSRLVELENEIHALLSPVARALTERGERVSAAESLTGGLLSAAFVDIPGSSNWFSDGFVTYSDEAKVRRLGVSAELIRSNTAVNAEVALAMASGALQKSGADHALALTGLAGPFEDEHGVPYALDPRHERGLTFIAYASRHGEAVRRFVFSGNRAEIRRKAVLKAVLMLANMMKIRA